MQPDTPKILIISSDTGGGPRLTAVKHLVKSVTLLLFLLSGLTVSYAQEVTVKATTNKKEVNAVLRREREKGQVNKAYFAEHDRCRDLLNARELEKAEKACRTAITWADKLPEERVLERSSVRTTLAFALILQRRPDEAVSLLKKSLEIGKSVIDDDDAETGDIYFLLANAFSLSNDIEAARTYLERAESTYRSAFVTIGDDISFRAPYSRRIREVVEAQYLLVKSVGLTDEAAKLQDRLAQVEKEFAKYLIN